MSKPWLTVEPGTPETLRVALQNVCGDANKVHIAFGVNGQSTGPANAKQGFLSHRQQGEMYVPILRIHPQSHEADDLETHKIVLIRYVKGEILWMHPNYKRAYDWGDQKFVGSDAFSLFLMPHFDAPLDSEGRAFVIKFGTEPQLLRWIRQNRKLDEV